MAEWRTVTIAAGHTARVRQSPQVADRSGYIRVNQSRRPAFEIEQRRWDQGTRL